MHGRREAAILVLPAILILVLIVIFPMLYSLVVSFHAYDLRVTQHPFIGLQNFWTLLTDPRFHNALRVTGLLVVSELPLQFALGLGLALLLARKISGKRVIQPLLLIPMMITPVVVGYMGRLLFEYRSGPINYLLGLASLPGPLWHASSDTALLTIVLLDTWQWAPFMMAVLLAGLVSLPREPYESALVDGASRLQIFWYITLPLLKRVIFLALIMRTLALLQSFDVIYVLTGGGPGTATETISVYTYFTGFRYWNIGQAASAAWVLAIILSIGITLFLRTLAKEQP